MAPRKATKHSDTEIVEKTAEAGDVSPPKRKKIAVRIASKIEKKEIRLPRAAKSAKTDNIEITETAFVTALTKNVKNKGKTVPPKNSATAVKANSKIKPVTRKGKDINEEVETKAQNTDVAQVGEEVPIKKSRAKTAIKKAGMEIQEEEISAGGKSKKRPKKNAVAADVEQVEEPTTKQKKNMENIDAAAKSDKPKLRATKKKPNKAFEAKNKVSTTKPKSASNNDNKINAEKTEELNVTQTSLQPTARKTRGRKNGSVDKTTGDALLEQDSKENQEAQNDVLDLMELIKPPKKGRNVRKKDESALQKASLNRSENTIDNDTTEEFGVSQKTNKKSNNNKSTSILPTLRKTRGRKMEASDETLPENDQESKIIGEVLFEQDTNENQEAQTDLTDTVEVIQEPKKGRNVRKIDESMPQKNIIKTRGKVANADTATNLDSTDTEKLVKDSQKKMMEGKENETLKAIPAIAVSPVGDNAGRRLHSVDTPINENETAMLVINNNMQKLSEQKDDGKESRTQLEKNSGKYREVSGIDGKHVEETVTIIPEHNV